MLLRIALASLATMAGLSVLAAPGHGHGGSMPTRTAMTAEPIRPVFVWPVAGNPRVVRPFDPPPKPWLAGHRGIDLATAAGAEVRASGDGVVAFAGRVAGRGVITIDHPGGFRTSYEPVTAEVERGNPVSAGTRLGASAAGHPGCPEEACLHWGLRRAGTYLDPLLLLGSGRVRLLPSGEAG